MEISGEFPDIAIRAEVYDLCLGLIYDTEVIVSEVSYYGDWVVYPQNCYTPFDEGDLCISLNHTEEDLYENARPSLRDDGLILVKKIGPLVQQAVEQRVYDAGF